MPTTARCAADEAAGAEGDAAQQKIARLIEQLGDPQFAVRQRAQQELIKLGFDAFDALSDAENSDDPEIAMQAAYLVRLIRAEWTRDGDPRPIQQILKDYDIQPDDRRLLRIKQLAELPDDQGLEWLCRLVRFEKSPVLSKQAALAIIAQAAPADEAAWTRRAATITKNLQHGRRPAAKWLLAYVQAHERSGRRAGEVVGAGRGRTQDARRASAGNQQPDRDGAAAAQDRPARSAWPDRRDRRRDAPDGAMRARRLGLADRADRLARQAQGLEARSTKWPLALPPASSSTRC